MRHINVTYTDGETDIWNIPANKPTETALKEISDEMQKEIKKSIDVTQ